MQRKRQSVYNGQQLSAVLCTGMNITIRTHNNRGHAVAFEQARVLRGQYDPLEMAQRLQMLASLFVALEKLRRRQDSEGVSNLVIHQIAINTGLDDLAADAALAIVFAHSPLTQGRVRGCIGLGIGAHVSCACQERLRTCGMRSGW